MFKDMKVASVMTPNPICVDIGEGLCKANRIMKVNNVRQLPVVSSGSLVGAVTELDVKVALNHRLSNDLTVAEVVNGETFNVHPEETLEDVVREMTQFKLDFVLVAQNRGELMGIFTRQDALELFFGFKREFSGAALRLVEGRTSAVAA